LQRITPIHPEVAEPLAAVLDETYGLIVYQEQVQSAARILAGYSLGRADVLRRAMGKKKPEVLAKEQGPFFEGMKEHGYSEEAAQAVWDILVPFSGYAFNKAHSAAYGLISYWTAYLKTHYPVEFMAALLQNERTNKDKTALYLGEARRMGIQVLPPDVNESILEYSAVGDVVRFGLGAIRNVGDKAVADIIAERETDRGRYVNFMDFIRRVPLTALNRRLVESLVKAGAFDSIDPNRRALFQIHEAAIDSVVSLKRKQAEGQFDLFADMDGDDGAEAMGDASVIVPDIEEWDKKTKLNFEREMLGLYVSDHPLSGMTAVLGGLREMSIAHLIDRAKTMDDRQQVTLAGLITSVDRRVSRKGNPWAIVTIEDMESSIQCMFFGKVYEAASQDLAVDEIVQIRGQVEVRDESTPSIRATELQVPTLEAADERPVMITLPTVALDRSRIGQLGQVLHDHPGYCEVKLAVLDERGNARVLTFGDRFRVKRDTSLFAEIKILFGPSCLPAA
jgi:DNA polymerase-3 subunit alpha